jgi:hypothetical protein
LTSTRRGQQMQPNWRCRRHRHERA